MGTRLKSWRIMKWGQQGPGTPQLPSSTEKVFSPLRTYLMTVRMNINIPYFPGLCSYPPVGNIAVYFILLYFLYPSVITVIPSYVVQGGGLLTPQFFT